MNESRGPDAVEGDEAKGSNGGVEISEVNVKDELV